MTAMSRRDFFLKALVNSEERQMPEPIENPEVVVGRVVDFPVGAKRVLMPCQVLVESLPEGLRAQSLENDRKFYSIKSNQIGELVVNRRDIWPASQVFSILTNEPTYFDTSTEDRS